MIWLFLTFYLFDFLVGVIELRLVEDGLDFDDDRHRIRRNNLIVSLVAINGTGLCIVDDDVLVVAHLIVHVDHESRCGVEAFRDVSVQELPDFFFRLSALFPGVRIGFTDVFEFVVKFLGSL